MRNKIVRHVPRKGENSKGLSLLRMFNFSTREHVRRASVGLQKGGVYMIIKIWPIKGLGKAKTTASKKISLKQSIDYISDEEKIAKSKPQIYDDERSRSLFEEEKKKYSDLTWEEFCINNSDDINRAVHYASNEQKTQGYVSGFLCDPEFAVEQFYQTKRINLERVGKSVEDDTGNIAYHIVQSFPPELDISDEEIHQCGIELLKKMGNYNEELGTYQGVVSSHVHPVIDEENEVHGLCKHNHIIINSHRHHEFIDPERPEKMKYHDCNRTYDLLQLINDQIALEHGLPIISEPDKDKTYSWKESEEKNKGTSWKARVQIDILNAMRASNNRDEYLRAMHASGYEMRIGTSRDHGEYISYTCPDKTHRISDFSLDQSCTLSHLESYWNLKKEFAEDQKENKDNKSNIDNDLVRQMLEQNRGQLFVKIERDLSDRRKEKRKEAHLSHKDKYALSIPIPTQWSESIQSQKSYFVPDNEYNIYNENRRYVGTVTGRDILSYLNELIENEKHREETEQDQNKQNYYWRADFINSRTKKPYRIRLRDENGRQRSSIELIFILAVVVIGNESSFGENQQRRPKYYEEKNNPIYGKRDWKIQNMLDAIRVAREQNLNTQEEVDAAVNIAGKNCSKARAAINRIDNSLNKMNDIYNAIQEYNSTRAVCEQLQEQNVPEENFSPEQKEALEKYKRSKAILYKATIKTDDEINGFLERRERLIEAKGKETANLDAAKEEYRRLRKMRYNMQLAQNKQYCYGAKYQTQQQAEQGKEDVQTHSTNSRSKTKNEQR